MCFLNILTSSAAGYYFFYANKKCLVFTKGLVCLSGLSTLAWMIYATVIIWGSYGTLCRDNDFLPKSGLFIYVWLVIMYVFLGIICCCACMMGCIISSNRKKDRHGVDSTPLH